MQFQIMKIILPVTVLSLGLITPGPEDTSSMYER